MLCSIINSCLLFEAIRTKPQGHVDDEIKTIVNKTNFSIGMTFYFSELNRIMYVPSMYTGMQWSPCGLGNRWMPEINTIKFE